MYASSEPAQKYLMFFNLLQVKLRSLPILLIISTRQCLAYQPIGRWGHSFAVTTAGIFVYGGKTDQYNSYSYTSAPNSNDLLFLPLNSTFDSTSPPWKLLDASSNVPGRSGPALAWHTVSAINDSCLILFGGQPGPDSPTESFSLADSTYFLNIADVSAPYWTFEPQSWGSEPARRIRHSSTLTGSSSLLIIGGERADGSNNAFSDNYAFDTSAASFLALSNTTGPANIFDHRSVMLSDGRLLVLGGYDQSQGALVPFSDIWSIDARNTTSTWSLITPSVTNLPTPRRAFVATLLYNNKVLIHGGADAVLQQNYDDGWILDASSDPMTWTKINTLTQLGSRRDHFAVSSGTQVLFGFGYSSSGPSSPTLYIYDVTKDAFVTTYTPSPSLSTSSLTPSNPTGTQYGYGTSGGASLTGSGGSASTDNPNPQNADVGSNRTTTTALAIVFSVLGAVIVIVVLYYMRRRHLRRGQFVSLADDDADSARSHSIPAVVMIDDNPPSERRSKFRIFPSFHLPNILANTHGSKPELPSRRDMLADEDVYDSEWYHLKRIRDPEGGSWSFRSFMSTRLRGQERSSTTNGSIRSHKREASDPFLDNYFPYEEAGLLERKEGYPDHVVKNLPPYPDPFVDSAEHEDEGATSLDMNSVPAHVASFPTDPVSLNLTGGLSSGSARKPADLPIERLDSTPQNITHSTEVASTMAYATSLINANRGPFQPIGPADPWWKRFTRNSFLDRKLSNTSKKSPSINYQEYNTTLMSIEEQTDTLALKTVATRSVEIVNNHVKTKSMSNLYDKTHGKSFSSFQTADTEAIEKIGCMVDVVQRDRTSSHHSSSSSVDVISFDGQQSLFKSDDPSAEILTASTTQATLSQAHHPDTAERPKDVETDLATSPLGAEDGLGGLVAARVRAYERKLSQDDESPRKTRKDSDDNKVKYGLAPRQSLFVANPDTGR